MDESSAAKESRADSVVAPTATPMPELIAERYRVLRLLGEGSSGNVFLCEHTALEKEVAVKVLHRELAANADLVERFKREAQTAAKLDHPSSVHVMDFGQDRDGTLYLVMEYVDGQDLSELLDDKLPLDDARIVHIMSCILSALSAAHALGIVHRDLKPENVMVRVGEPDVVKVCDFGVAQFSPVRYARRESGPISTQKRRVTGEGMMVGTPWYMSPEQARAEALDARSDIYSAGVVLFQLLTRTLPFVSDDIMAVALMHCTQLPPPPSGFGAVHPGLESVCLRALSKTPEARFQSAAEMLQALRDAVATSAPSRSLARVSRPPSPGTMLALAPVTLHAAATPMATPSVRLPPTLRRAKLRPSLLIAGVATTLLGVAAVPRFLPSQHQVVTSSLDKIDDLLSKRGRVQPAAASVSIQNDPELLVSSEPALGDLPLAMAEPAAEALALVPELPPEPKPVAVPVVAAPIRPKVELPRAAAAAPENATPAADHAAEPKPAAVVPPVAAPKPAAAVTQPPVAAPHHDAGLPKAEPAKAPEAGGGSEPARTAPLPAATPAAPPAQPEPAAPASKPLPAKIARVDVSAERLPPGVSRASLRSALSQDALLGCYTQAQLRARQTELPGTALELKTNTSGRIVSARATNAALAQPVRECLETVARSGQIRTGEGGEVQVTLSVLPAS
jgi:eukaryotic-like serine/threonine-protein kinase